MEIAIHKDHFRRNFEFPSKEITYTLDKPMGLKNFKHSTSINHLVINLMEKKKVPFKDTHLKPKVITLHYLLTRILFARVINHKYVVMEDIIPLWLLN